MPLPRKLPKPQESNSIILDKPGLKRVRNLLQVMARQSHGWLDTRSPDSQVNALSPSCLWVPQESPGLQLASEAGTYIVSCTVHQVTAHSPVKHPREKEEALLYTKEQAGSSSIGARFIPHPLPSHLLCLTRRPPTHACAHSFGP